MKESGNKRGAPAAKRKRQKCAKVIPLHLSNVERKRTPLRDGLVYNLTEGRSVEVWSAVDNPECG